MEDISKGSTVTEENLMQLRLYRLELLDIFRNYEKTS